MESDVTQSAAFYKTWAWAEAHRKHLLYGAAGVLVIGIGVGFYVWQQDQKQTSASEALSLVEIQSAVTGQQPTPDALLKVNADYPNTTAGERALLAAAGRSFTTGKYADAQTQFEKFLNQYRTSDFGPQASLGIAASLEAQGKAADALKAYKDVSERRANEMIAAQAKLGMARIYEAQGNLKDARDTYQQLVRPENQSIAEEASEHLRALLAKNPSLNEAPVAASNAPTLKMQ